MPRHVRWFCAFIPLLGGCLDLAAKPFLGAVDGAVGLVAEIDAGAARPPNAAPIPLPDCGLLVWNAGLGGDPTGALSGMDGGPGAFGGTGDDVGGTGNGPGTSARPEAGEVVVSEVMHDPALLGDTQGEWLELHNRTSRALDLQGCVFDDGGGTLRLLADSLSIAPGAQVTLARGTSPGFAPDVVMPMSLGNSADVVAISCDGVEIDRVAYGPGFPLAAGASLSLDPEANDAARNDSPGAWCLADAPYAMGFGTPGAPNPSCAGDDADAGTP